MSEATFTSIFIYWPSSVIKIIGSTLEIDFCVIVFYAYARSLLSLIGGSAVNASINSKNVISPVLFLPENQSHATWQDDLFQL